MRTIELFDTTLRDGTQVKKINLSVDDKIKITKQLDKLGIDFIEGGWPGSNPLAVEYFEQMKGVLLYCSESCFSNKCSNNRFKTFQNTKYIRKISLT